MYAARDDGWRDSMEQQLFIKVDSSGEVTDCLFGENVIPTESYDFFFLVEKEVAENIYDYKVVIQDFKPSLVLKEVE